MLVEFTKMSGAGNDFIVLDNRDDRFSDEDLSNLAIRLCPRRTRVGADGILALGAPAREDVHFRMVYFNADGSRGTMCGNGARCLSRFAGLIGMAHNPLLFSTDAGVYRAEVPPNPEDGVKLFVPAYRDYRAHPGLSAAGALSDIHFIWTGTEHLVVFVKQVDQLHVSELGPRLRSDPGMLPAGANVNFVEIVNAGSTGKAEIRVRTYEKGVESETLSCGTGAIASSIVCCLTNKTAGRVIRVSMPGGELEMGFSGSASAPIDMYLQGPADIIYQASTEL